jgi:hypothetical protein
MHNDQAMTSLNRRKHDARATIDHRLHIPEWLDAIRSSGMISKFANDTLQ